MKITIEYHDRKVTVENETAIDITDVLDLIEQALVKIGYEPQRIQAAYRFKAAQED